MKRPLVYFLGALILGEFLAGIGQGLHIICAAFGVPALFIVFKKDAIYCGICISLVLVGYLRAGQAAAEYRQFEDLSGEIEIAAEGTVWYYGETSSGWRLVLKNVSVTEQDGDSCGVSVRMAELYTAEKPEVHPGARMVLEATIKPFETARNEGNFDETSYYHSKGIAFRGKLIRVLACKRQGSTLAKCLLDGKEAGKQALLSVYGEKMARFYSGILFGDASLVDEQQKDLFYRQGIGHILAISGLHVSIMGRSFYRMLRRRFGFAGSFVLAALALLGFGYVTGSSVSAVRAVLMLLLWMGAEMAGRTYDFVSALCASAFLLLLEQPYCLYSAAFQLSFGCMILLGVLVPVFCGYLGCGGQLEKSAATSILLTVLLAPLTARIFYVCPVYAGLLNLLVIPCMTIVLLSGIFAVLFSLVSPTLAVFFAGPGYFCIVFYETLCRIVGQLPFARIVFGKPSLLRVCVLYTAAALAAWIFNRHKTKGTRLTRYVALSVCAVCFLCSIRTKDSHSLSIYHLDVGQGDCCVVSERDGITVMMDAGSGSVRNVGARRIIPFLQAKGISTLDYIVVSHSDMDHINAIREIISEETVVIRELWIYLEEDDEKMQLLAEEAQSNGILLHEIKKGDRITGKQLTVDVLWPTGEELVSDRNEASVVALLQCGWYIELFTGDSGELAEQYLISNGLCPKLTCLKAAHHGSKYASTSSFLEHVSPSVAILSAGVNNRYGHPHPETLERLEAVGCTHYNTAEQGCISLYPDDRNQELLVKPYLVEKTLEEMR